MLGINMEMNKEKHVSGRSICRVWHSIFNINMISAFPKNTRKSKSYRGLGSRLRQSRPSLGAEGEAGRDFFSYSN